MVNGVSGETCLGIQTSKLLCPSVPRGRKRLLVASAGYYCREWCIRDGHLRVPLGNPRPAPGDGKRFSLCGLTCTRLGQSVPALGLPKASLQAQLCLSADRRTPLPSQAGRGTRSSRPLLVSTAGPLPLCCTQVPCPGSAGWLAQYPLQVSVFFLKSKS